MQRTINKVSFKEQNIFVGIDAHKRSWKVSISVETQIMKTFSQDPKPDILIRHLRKNYPGGRYRVGYEAGFCGFWIYRFFKEAGLDTIVLNPADIPTTDKDRKQKEDARDSKKIVKTLMDVENKGIYVPCPQQEQDRFLLRTRQSIVTDMGRIKNRIKAALHMQGIEYPEVFSSTGTHWSNRFILWLEQLRMKHNSWNSSFSILLEEYKHKRALLLKVNGQIRALARTDRYKGYMDLLISIPGVGMITGMTLLTEIWDIRRFKSPDKLASFLGLIPTTHSSGSKERTGGMTKRFNKYMRSLLIECAWSLIRSDPSMALKHAELRKRMESQKAIVRIAKKLVLRIRAMLLTGTYYQVGAA